MYYNMDSIIKDLSYDELVKILKEQNTELLYLKGENRAVKSYYNLVEENKKLYDELNKLAAQYNTLRLEYIKLKGKEQKQKNIDISRVKEENEALQAELEAVKKQAEVDVKALKRQEVKSLEVVGQYIDELEKKQFRTDTLRGSSLSKSKKEKVIKGICKGLNDSQISKAEKIDRKAVKKIRTAAYKSKKTNQEILGIINHLLKINQNPGYIKKLQDLKQTYLSNL